MYDKVKAPIVVTARFHAGKPEILSFEWQGHTHQVKEIHIATKAFHGRELVWLFSISTATAAYKLRFNTDSLQWFLEELVWDEQQDI